MEEEVHLRCAKHVNIGYKPSVFPPCNPGSTAKMSELPSDNQPAVGTFDVLFLGTGVSTAVPNLQHVINTARSRCTVCHDALDLNSKNRRSNVSIGMIFNDQSGVRRCVVVDVGKTMRDGCLRLFPRYGVEEVAGIILTHGHADAIFGLDDARDLQLSEHISVKNDAGVEAVGFKILSGPLPVYLNNETMGTVRQVFNYLTTPPVYLDEKNSVIERRVALLDFNVVDSNAEFTVAGLPVRAFPVYHGGKYVSLGFSFGKAGEFVYISDVSTIPDETMDYLKSLPRIKVFVIDVLSHQGIFAHMGLDDALGVVRALQPERVYFTGMSCSIGMHDEMNERLAEIAPGCQLAHDGLLLQGFAMA
jgi:phosphoribosyl 1,2-cyclic phosphodiesterase